MFTWCINSNLKLDSKIKEIENYKTSNTNNTAIKLQNKFPLPFNSYINLVLVLDDCGVTCSAHRKPTLMRGKHANSTRKGAPHPGTEPSWCEVTVLSSKPPCQWMDEKLNNKWDQMPYQFWQAKHIETRQQSNLIRWYKLLSTSCI